MHRQSNVRKLPLRKSDLRWEVWVTVGQAQQEYPCKIQNNGSTLICLSHVQVKSICFLAADEALQLTRAQVTTQMNHVPSSLLLISAHRILYTLQVTMDVLNPHIIPAVSTVFQRY
jgi:hypothetical protein